MIEHIPVEFAEIGEAEEVPIVDLEAEERRERDEAIINYFERAAHILNAYQSHQSTAKELRMSTRAMWLALGWNIAAGADGPAQLARSCRCSKQTLGKCLNNFIAQLRLEPLPFQRKAGARAAMSQARKAQIYEKTKTEQRREVGATCG